MSDTAVIFSILATDKTKGAFKSVGKGLAELFAGKEIFDFGKESIKAGEDAQKTQAKVNAIFGESSERVKTFAEGAAKSTGLSADAAESAAAQFGQLGKAAGLSGTQLSQFSISSTHLAADLASFNNADPAAVQDALAKGFAGSTKALKPYGILMDNASLKAEALTLGLIHAKVSTTQVAAAQNSAQKAQEAYNKAVADHGKNSQQAKDASIRLASAEDGVKKATAGVTGALTPQQKVLAAHALIMQQAGDKLGDFKKQSGTAANQQKILTAELDNAKEKIGTGLLPVITKFAGILVGVIGFVEAHSSWLVPLIAGIAAVVAGLKVWSVVQELLNIELEANPIGAIVIAIVALVAIIVIAIKYHKQIEAAAKAAWHTIQNAAMAVWNWLKSNWPYIAGILLGPFGIAAAWIYKHWDSVVGFVKKLPGRIASAAKGMWDGIRDAFKSAVNWLINGWNNLSFKIPSIGFGPFHTPGFTLNTPNIPLLAAGGIIKAMPGGTAAILGEGGRDEAVIPLPRGGSLSTLGQPTVIELHFDGDFGAAVDLLMNGISAKVRGSHNGNVQLALGGVGG